MAIVIGIDVGISTTKIVGLREGRVVSPIRITAADQVTSLYGAFGKYLHDNKIELKDVEQVMVTGVGASYVNEPIYGIPTQKVDEFIADGLGARFESGLTKAIVVSMGTGTSFVQCDGDEVKHIGGIGIGGGTLQGLSRDYPWTPLLHSSRKLNMTRQRKMSHWESSPWCYSVLVPQPSLPPSTLASKTSYSLVTLHCCRSAKRYTLCWRNSTTYISTYPNMQNSAQP